MSHSAENDVSHEKWREAGWASPDEIFAALTDDRLRLAKVRAVVAEAQEMGRRGPGQFRTGQEHLPPAFREVNWEAAFKAVAALLTKVEDAVETSLWNEPTGLACDLPDGHGGAHTYHAAWTPDRHDNYDPEEGR